MIFSINSIEGCYCVYEWEFGIRCSSSIKEAIKYTGVEWICSRTEELFESLEEARNYALQAVETIENGKQFHYFVIYREHGPYHEFQPGKNTFELLINFEDESLSSGLSIELNLFAKYVGKSSESLYFETPIGVFKPLKEVSTT